MTDVVCRKAPLAKPSRRAAAGWRAAGPLVALSLCLAPMWAGGARAQDLVFDITDTLACLDAAGDAGARRACIGTAAGACMSANSAGGSTVGMGGCLDFERAYWDDRLNASYQALRAKERRDDADWAGQPGAVSKADALRDMQRAWIGFRDATCDYERSQWGGGTGGGPATLACLLRMTAEQALYLEEMMVSY